MKIKFLTVITLSLVAFMAACGKSDADIQKAVAAKLAADNVPGVTVAVKDGVATLTGEVADITVKNKANASAKSVEGVKSVTDSTTLKPLPTPAPAPADPMLKGKVEENLKKADAVAESVLASRPHDPRGLAADHITGKAARVGPHRVQSGYLAIYEDCDGLRRHRSGSHVHGSRRSTARRMASAISGAASARAASTSLSNASAACQRATAALWPVRNVGNWLTATS